MTSAESAGHAALPAPEHADDTLAQRAYRLVRERILKGVYPPGAALSRRRLAHEFGMSLLPVAEALQRLVNEGLLESRPRVGTRVRQPSREEIRDRYTLPRSAGKPVSAPVRRTRYPSPESRNPADGTQA